ncbi:MAG TPA: NlpC/P60 family protein [Fodinibius sp.]|nr:NlpC/P60 family protein [Fodinibius sp.]
MAHPKALLLIFFAGFLMGGCGVAKRTATSAHRGGEKANPIREEASPPMMGVTSVNTTEAGLREAYREWKGTPYRWGGTTLRGIDCSMFVNTVFEDYFDINLPRSTRAQLSAGDGVRRSAIRTGDLVFFRTGRKTLHVGIMVNQKQFMHASTSEGVTISRIAASYWSNRYLAARRVM